MGVDGQRLDPAEMAARGYTLSVNDVYIVVEIPIGAVGGYFKVSGTETESSRDLWCALSLNQNLYSMTSSRNPLSE